MVRFLRFCIVMERRTATRFVSWRLGLSARAGGVFASYFLQVLILSASHPRQSEPVNGQPVDCFDRLYAVSSVFQIDQFGLDALHGLDQPIFTPSKLSSMDRLCAVLAPKVICGLDVPMVSVVLKLDIPQFSELPVLGEEIVVFRSEIASHMSRIRFRQVHLTELIK